MSSFLDTMARSSRQRVEEAVRARPLAAVAEAAAEQRAPRPIDGFGRSFDLIAEIKPRSPATGAFPVRDYVESASSYRQGGAAMISVLTEPGAFGGSLDVLCRVGSAVDIPVMAKDFLVDPYQVYQARASGADGILLIARILPDEALSALRLLAESLGMFTLLEVFDQHDLDRVLAASDHGSLIGVNCRDLDSLDVAPDRHRDLAGSLPAGRVAVAESGLHGPEDVERVAALGYRAALVGSSLMRSDRPADVVSSMIEAGRRAEVVVQ
jgi:indole-3-glycerol phosphate synthase